MVEHSRNLKANLALGCGFRRFSDEEALPLGSIEPGKEKQRVRTVIAAHELLPEGLQLESLGSNAQASLS
ncbi:MAG: hypothetical protein H0V21_02025 [Rubrobacter sp.]|nr:hypothetical protein [Rubrobacter sp.]